MKKPSETVATQIINWLVPIVVLVALCFSIGEGLRLTPFPVSSFAVNQAANGRFAFTASPEVSRHNYGPIDVPPQNQKRSKRHTVEFACAPSRIVPSPPICRDGLCDQQEPHVVNALFVAQLAGRDPPSHPKSA